MERAKEIQGRPYLNWVNYLKCRGRRVKGDFGSGSRPGLVLSQWNRWVGSEGGKGAKILGKTKVDNLNCYAERYQYQLSHDVGNLANALRRREKLLVTLDVGQAGDSEERRLRGKAMQWKEMAEDYFGELHALQLDFGFINQRYFDGQSGLFPGSASEVSQLVEQAEKLVDLYNRDLAADLELLDSAVAGSNAQGSENRHTIDPSNLLGKTQGAATDQDGYLVDMAKAEALDMMGETERAVAIMDRHN